MRLGDRSLGLPHIALTGFGLATALGDDAESTAVTLECGLSAMRAIRIPDKSGNQLVGCPAIEIGTKSVYTRRLWSFALRAAKEAIDRAKITPDMRDLKFHIYWTLPSLDREGYRLNPGSEHLADFLSKLELPFQNVESHLVFSGHAGALAAMDMVRDVLASDDRVICLIGGADTLIQLRVLRWLERNDRLKTEFWPDGLIPGEGGAFLVVELSENARRRGVAAFCQIEHLSFQNAEGEHPAINNARAERLTKALRMVLPREDASRKTIARIYCDLNGENRRALEWGLASARVMDPEGLVPEVVHPADCLGDVGAISATMNIALAALWMQDLNPGTRFIVFACSETGERAALTGFRTPDCPKPSTRCNTSASDELLGFLAQNFDELSFLWWLREGQQRASNLRLPVLALLDRRLQAHARALLLAGETGRQVSEQAFQSSVPNSVGDIFAATVRAIEDKNVRRLYELLALAEAILPYQRGLISAFGWVSAQHLQGTVAKLLASTEPFKREVGLAACAMHRADPGQVVGTAITDSDTSLRARGLRVAGAAGRRDLLPVCTALADEDAACRFWAAHSAVLLGDRSSGINALKDIALNEGPHQVRALQSVLKVISPPQSNEFLKLLATSPANKRVLIQGAGIAGDPYYIPWLIKQMDDLKFSRLAGESFSFITGLDLAYLDLERKPPEGVEFGPDDNPEDDKVAMDEDDSLPWPDPIKIQAWWEANKPRFTNGQRYFMGAPVTREHCLQVLKEGYQRQRIAAAEYLCLFEPGTKLFPTRAPAWRQQRWLARMI